MQNHLTQRKRHIDKICLIRFITSKFFCFSIITIINRCLIEKFNADSLDTERFRL